MISDNVQIAKTVSGPVEYLDEGEGPTVLCIHGAMGGYDQSITLGRAIGEKKYRYIAVSRPGYLGTPIKCGKTPEQQADLHATLLDFLGIKSVIVMAISGGGPSAINFAIRHPQKCSKLVLCSTICFPQVQKIPFSFHMMTALAWFTPLIKSMQKKTTSNLESTLSRSISDPDLLRKTLDNKEIMELFNVVNIGMFDQLHKRTAGTKNDIIISSGFNCNLQSITVPTLIIHGDKDPLAPFEIHGKRLAEEIPGAKLCLLKGGEHVAIFTHNEQVRDAVKKFLNDNG